MRRAASCSQIPAGPSADFGSTSDRSYLGIILGPVWGQARTSCGIVLVSMCIGSRSIWRRCGVNSGSIQGQVGGAIWDRCESDLWSTWGRPEVDLGPWVRVDPGLIWGQSQADAGRSRVRTWRVLTPRRPPIKRRLELPPECAQVTDLQRSGGAHGEERRPGLPAVGAGAARAVAPLVHPLGGLRGGAVGGVARGVEEHRLRLGRALAARAQPPGGARATP